MKNSVAQVVFSSVLPVWGLGREGADRIKKIRKCLRERSHEQGFSYVCHRTSFEKYFLLNEDGACLSGGGSNIFGNKIFNLIRRIEFFGVGSLNHSTLKLMIIDDVGMELDHRPVRQHQCAG